MYGDPSFEKVTQDWNTINKEVGTHTRQAWAQWYSGMGTEQFTLTLLRLQLDRNSNSDLTII